MQSLLDEIDEKARDAAIQGFEFTGEISWKAG